MTVSATTRRAGPFSGNGVATSFPFAFKVFTSADIAVVRADSTGAETTLVLNSDYTVSLNANQDTTPGGSVVLSSALASGYTLAIVGSLAYSQGTDLPTGGAFNAQNVEDALDRLTMLAQQLQELSSRAVTTGATSSVTGATLLASINAAVASASASATSAQTSLNTFQGQYYGAAASDPTVDPLGAPCTAGDLYFSTGLLRMRTYTGSAWVDVGTATPLTVTPQQLSGTGSQTVFTLSTAPAFQAACEVFISGVRQVPGVDYTVSGTTLTFTTAPAAGTSNIFANIITAYAGGVPNDGSVTTAKFAPGAVAPAATNLASGVAGAVPYQTGSGATGFSAAGTAGQVLLSGGAGAPTWGATAQHGFKLFDTAGGTFTQGVDCPAGVTVVRVSVWGGGGGGCGGAFTSSGTGGAGGYGAALITLTAGQAVTVTRGAGGAGGTTGNNGVAGGTSSFGTFVSCTGGGAGLYAAGAGTVGANGVATLSGVTQTIATDNSVRLGIATSGGTGSDGANNSGGGGGAGFGGGGGGAGFTAGSIGNAGYGWFGVNNASAATLNTSGGTGGNSGGAGGATARGGGGGGGGAVLIEW